MNHAACMPSTFSLGVSEKLMLYRYILSLAGPNRCTYKRSAVQLIAYPMREQSVNGTLDELQRG
jgi:hypothetical protein